MLYVHSIEKGLCMENARPFGFSKVKNLVKILKNEKDKEKFEYQAGIAVLNAWIAFFKEKGWEHAICKEVESFLSTQENIDIKCGEKAILMIGQKIITGNMKTLSCRDAL